LQVNKKSDEQKMPAADFVCEALTLCSFFLARLPYSDSPDSFHVVTAGLLDSL
jgi:hypothetical protein